MTAARRRGLQGRRSLRSRAAAASSAHLRDAVDVRAAEPFAKALQALVTWYETGLDSDREAFDIAWVQNRDSAVDTMNGFIEVYMDARGMKGAWEGIVYYANHEKTDKIRALATHAQWFEDHLPIDPKYRKPTVQGVSAQAIEVVVEVGDSGPITPIGVNLPNDQRIREEYGSKSVSLSNVLDAYERSMPDSFRQEFAWDDAEVRAREAVGRVCERADDGDSRSAGPRLRPHGRSRDGDAAGPAEGAVLGARRDARRSGGVVFRRRSVSRRDRPGAGRRAAGRGADRVRGVCAQRAGAAAARPHRRAARRRPHAQPPGDRALAARQHQGDRRRAAATRRPTSWSSTPTRSATASRRLLAEVQRIKSEGDYAAAKELFETYGVHFDPELRDEVVARVDHLNLPSYTGFVMPKLEPVTDGAGAITDVKISYPCDLTSQMLEYSAL